LPNLPDLFFDILCDSFYEKSFLGNSNMIEVFFLFMAASMTAKPVDASQAINPVENSEKAVGKIESRYFSTTTLPPPYKVPKQFEEGYKIFKKSGASVPESVLVKSILLLGNTQLGLTKASSKMLSEHLEQVYRSIDNDPLFRNLPSALPYCLSDKRPTKGHYFAYYPAKLTEKTPVIVFLHGFSGNVQFNAYLLKEEFPDAVILLPSWGISWHNGDLQYISDMLKDVREKKSITISTPILMAISAGGPTGFRLYNENPDYFSCFISLASAPPLNTVPTLKRNLKILMVNGKKDTIFPISKVQSTAAKLTAQLSHFRLEVLDSDHFFLLSKREETFNAIKSFLEKEAGIASEKD
jgi:hypothetical protein